MSFQIHNPLEQDFSFVSTSNDIYRENILQSAGLSKKETLNQKRQKQKQKFLFTNLSTIQEKSKLEVRKMQNRQAAQVSRDKKQSLLKQLQEENVGLKFLLKERDEFIKTLSQENNNILNILTQYGYKSQSNFEWNQCYGTQIEKRQVSSEFEEQYSIQPDEIEFSPNTSQSPTSDNFSNSKKKLTSLGILCLFTIVCLVTMLKGPVSKDQQLQVHHNDLQSNQCENSQSQDCVNPLSQQCVNPESQILQESFELKTFDQPINQLAYLSVDDHESQLDIQQNTNSISNSIIQISPIDYDEIHMGQLGDNEISYDQPQKILFMNCRLQKSEQCLEMLHLMINENSSYADYKKQDQVQQQTNTNQIIIFDLDQDQNQVYLQSIQCQIIALYLQSIKSNSIYLRPLRV